MVVWVAKLRADLVYIKVEMDSVTSTANDAINMRASIASKGYISDPYVSIFAKKKQFSPIINRGSFARTASIDLLITTINPTNIVSIGAGLDSRFFHLKSANKHPQKYFELDLPEVTSKKIMLATKHPQTSALLSNHTVSHGGSKLVSDDYIVVPCDLADFASVLPELGISNERTLFIAECVLVYLDPQATQSILAAIPPRFSNAFFIAYDPINPSDSFGSTMISNLGKRNLSLPGIFKYNSIQSTVQRYYDAGWSIAKAIDLLAFYTKYLPQSEKERISKIEIFDEIEEWSILQQHYCISWAACSHPLPDQSPQDHQSSLLKYWFENNN